MQVNETFPLFTSMLIGRLALSIPIKSSSLRNPFFPDCIKAKKCQQIKTYKNTFSGEDKHLRCICKVLKVAQPP